jgi:hypothetical protein
MLNVVMYRGLTDAGSRLINEVVGHFYSKEIQGEDNCYCETREEIIASYSFYWEELKCKNDTQYSTKQCRLNAACHLLCSWLATVFIHRHITNCTTHTKYKLFVNILSKFLEQDDRF